MICAHNRPLRRPCIDCEPVSFFEQKLREALEKDDAGLRRDIERWQQRAKEAQAEREHESA